MRRGAAWCCIALGAMVIGAGGADAENLFKRACVLGDQAGCDYLERKP